MLRYLALLACLAGSVVFTCCGASAQEAAQPAQPKAPATPKDATPAKDNKAAPKAKDPAPAAAPAKPAAGGPAPAAGGSLGLPEPEALLMLIRTTLIALNQANQTGNYTVLRDLGSPGFQAVNTAAQLAISFANLRQQNLDLSPITVVTPQATEPPSLTDKGLLRIVGFFPTAPLQIKFELLFEPVAAKWRLSGMAVTAVPAQAKSP